MNHNTAWYAQKYVSRFGFHIVPIEPMRKFPRSNNWGNNTISTPEAAREFYTKHPDWNIGIALAPSRMCSLDIDCDSSFAVILDELGIDPESIQKSPTIQGSAKGRRVMFRVPEGVSLPYQKLTWPSKNDPTGDKHKAAMAIANTLKQEGATDKEARVRNVAKRWARYTVLELRSSCDGKQRQDVAPPSIHPDTGKPYVWLSQPTDVWPCPPNWLLAIWQSWDTFKPQLSSMCPWMPASANPYTKTAAKPQPRAISGNVIQAFCDAHDLEATLEQFGYQRKGKRRYLSPHSSTGLPGVMILPDGNRCYIHHASDPLCSDDKGRPVNAFDLFCYYEHNNDIKAAVRAAAGLLGLTQKQTQYEHATSTEQTLTTTNKGVCDYISLLSHTKENGKPKNHIENLREICKRFGVVLRYDVIKKNEQIIIPNESFTMDNEANASLAWLASECSLFDFSTDKLGEFITYLADKNQYNPVAAWVESKEWDGQNRLDALCSTITTKGCNNLKNTLIKRWLISAIAAAYLPTGISAPGVLTLQGSQYLGKTKWFKSLVPHELDLIQDGMLLRSDDKDSVKQVCSYWLVELGELDSTFRKSDIAQLKAFITKQVDILRPAYAKREAKYPRRTVFFGSVNPREFLHDPTGNRRFWTIECESIDHTHGIDMQQLWAEVLEVWRDGEGYYLTAEEMTALNEHNTDFMSIDPIEERLFDRLDWEAPDDLWRWQQASALLIECGLDRPSRADAAAAGQLIRSRNGNQSRKSAGQKLLRCPPVKTKHYI